MHFNLKDLLLGIFYGTVLLLVLSLIRQLFKDKRKARKETKDKRNKGEGSS